MASFEGSILDFRRLDRLAAGETALHRLDARAKVLVTIVFILSVVSFDRYALAPLVPFFLYPAVVLARGSLPAGYFARKVALVLPFALAVGMLNPLFDREVAVRLGPFGIPGGWVSCASIVVRAVLTVSAALLLVGVTGFPEICRAMERLGVPQAFTVQLLFLYRYIFVLTEEGARSSRARELRSFGGKGLGIASYGSLVGHLLLRTWMRADRIHMAMLSRGFTGEFHARRPPRFGGKEALFLLGWSTLFVVLRLHNIPQLLGSLVTGGVR
ncbi:MAG: cobalt transporter, inner rane subunit CbiQ [Deltaproteobacteria bacterium]|jgi:cobalt/nickel transport system permease protein|nr:cobalt transporter, inner rane subunit CbiQ [Deltaproteobacteria bacterium]